MALGLGATKGLSYVNDWDKDIERVYQQAEYAAGVKAKKEQETLFYANLMKKGHGSTPYVEGKLNSFYKDHTKKVADFAINNPNFRTDVSKMQEFLDLNDQFLNNPILQQDQQVKQQFEKLQAAYNAKSITRTHFEREMQKYNAYAYADPTTDADPYMFADPKQVDVNKLIGEAQSITPVITRIDKNGVKIDTYQGVDPTAVMNTANSLLADEDNAIAMQKEYDDAIARDSSIKTSFKTLQEYTASRIEAGNKMQMVKSDYDEAYLRKLSNSSGKAADVPGGYFMRNIYPTLNALKDGETASADLHGLPLTPFSEIGGVMVSNPSKGVKVRDTTGKLVDLGVTIKMEALGFSSYVKHGGKLYGEVDVNANSSLLDAEGLPIQRGLVPQEGITYSSTAKNADSYLRSLGFIPAAQNSANPMAGFMNPTGMDYSGKVYVELDTSTSRLVDVDRSYGGQTEVPKAQGYYEDPYTQFQVDYLNKDQKVIDADLKRGIESIGVATYEDVSEYGKPFEYVKFQGKETDASGNRYGKDPVTGTVFIVKKS